MKNMKEWIAELLQSKNFELFILVFMAGGARAFLDNKDPKWWRIFAEGLFISCVTIMCGRILPILNLHIDWAYGIGAFGSAVGAQVFKVWIKKRVEKHLDDEGKT